MSQDQYNEAYDLGYTHGKQRAYLNVAVIVAAIFAVGTILYPLLF